MASSTDHPDLDLLLGWRHGDARMGAALYDRHKQAVTNLFRRNVQNKQDIPDLVQQTFLACLHAENDPEISASVRGYILGIAFHTMTAFFRRARMAPVFGLDEEQGTPLASIEPDPEYLISLGDEQRLLMKAIRRLPIEYQVIIELNYWESITCDEIALILQVPKGTVRSRLKRGRAALEKNLAALADSPELLAATTVSLGGWQRGIHMWIAAQAGSGDRPG